MGWSFRKSVKIGGVRLNTSKSGIGVSAGVKGARIGINSKGNLYSSVGGHGIYNKKTVSLHSASKSSNRHSSQNQQSDELPPMPAGNSLKMLLFIIGIICGFAFPILFLLPVLVLVSIFIDKKYSKIAEQFEESIEVERISENYSKIEEILNEIDSKKIPKKFKQQIYSNTYFTILRKLANGVKPTVNSSRIIDFYRNHLDSTIFENLSEMVFNDVFNFYRAKLDTTNAEVANLDEIANIVFTDGENKRFVKKALDEICKIIEIHKNGLDEFLFEDKELGQKAYWHKNVELFKIHHSHEQEYFEKEANADLCVSPSGIEIIKDGHNLIKYSEIIKVENRPEFIEIIIRNKRTPICISSDEQNFVYTLITTARNVTM